MPLVETASGYRAQLDWDHETGHWSGQIDGTEVRFTARNYFAAVRLFEETASILAEQDKGKS